VPHACQLQQKRNFSNPFSLKAEVIATQEYLRSKTEVREVEGKRREYILEYFSSSDIFKKGEKKRRQTQLSLEMWHTAHAAAKVAISPGRSGEE